MAIKATYLIGQFPVLYERALLEEIAACVRAGIDGRIAAFGESGESLPESLRILADRVDYLDVARKAGRFLSGIAGIGFALHYGRYSSPLALTWAGDGARLFARRTRLARLLDMKRPDLVHAQFGHLGMNFLPVIRRPSLPLVVSFRGQDVGIVRRVPERARQGLFDYAARVLVRCNAMAESVAYLGCPTEKIHVLPSGTILEDIPFSRRSAPLAERDIVILMAGRLVRKKGMDDGLHAFARCRPDADGPRIRIAGDGPEREALENLAKKLGIADRVEFQGKISREDLLSEMAGAHVFLLPCKRAPDGDIEGIPNVIKEAQASGLPVVSTRHAGIPECVADGVSGFLADEGDVDGIGNALDRILSIPERWGEFGERGRAIVVERFAMRRCAPALLEHYRAVARRGENV